MSSAESTVDSPAGTFQPESTAASSPVADDGSEGAEAGSTEADQKDSSGLEDPEAVDNGVKALMHLLQASKVFSSIMEEKMRSQQEERPHHVVNPVAMPNKMPQQRLQIPPAQPARRKGAPRKLRAKKEAPLPGFSKKADVEVPEKNTTVQEALVQAADEFEANPTALGEQDLVATQQPKLVSGGQMRKYQLEGLEWLKTLWMNGLCGILADEMGLGKTVQAISMIAHMKESKSNGPFLIAGPLSTVGNWIEEIGRWTPGINAVKYHGSKEERAELRKKQMQVKDQKKADFPVVCTSYEICINDKKFLSQYDWQYIIVDEGHRLKNFNCRLIKELLNYRSANRLLITGTPLQNNISELWSLLHFLLPQIFNDLDSFQSWFDFSSVLDEKGQEATIEKRNRNLISTMHAILKPFLLRRVKSDVEHSLPKKREYILYAPMTTEQKDLYREILNGTGRQHLEAKALERINKETEASGSKTRGTKRRRESSESGSPVKRTKTSPQSKRGDSGRRRSVKTYKEMSDREFNARLRKIDRGEELDDEEDEVEFLPDDTELEELRQKKNLDLAKKEIGHKKMQNPVMQARMACNSPHNFYWPWKGDVDESLVSASGKMQLLDRLIPCLLEKGHKILIFSQFKVQLDIIAEWATTLRSWECCRIDGAMSQSDRQDQIKAFNTDPDFKIFLLSTRAGGQGINLTAADTVILFDSDWNPQQDLQAQDRAHRIGQKKPVIVYRLATKGTVEQTLLEKADAKRRLERLVIQKGKFRSLLDPNSNSHDFDDIRKALGEDEFERFDVGAGSSVLSDEDLSILTDRSEEAYARNEKGLDRTGAAFVSVETKANGSEALIG
ncbi:swi2/snf2-like protein [Penicillium chermesinum]|uniref:Swi2/snf2-like protein n=1 Tax=Penicillium chermesinum TaxID=63820 RepID=A0A9W9PIV9_9EURO|nr:swi2/snf2-like protein [Penicillium chermesinum]KAJ5247529.1 swi2/snf2-like protein [Penicillium chermesinum]